ncbi:MAG: hypothetical protein JSS68_08600 [Actinobacteria bacterium]|nr:hypothetical protein [Actinomycetota bacterium]
MDDENMDAAVLDRLCRSGPWTTDELRRELGLAGHDAADRLVAKGLAHRIGDFVFASVSGRHAHSLDPTWR